MTRKRAIEPLKIGYTVAEGLAAGDPGRKGAWALRILNETGGVAGEAEDAEILEAQSPPARTEGYLGRTDRCRDAGRAPPLAGRRAARAQ